MPSYAKIYGSIFMGSLRGKSDDILVFVNILTHTTKEGEADIHPRVIAEETGLPMDRVGVALRNLSSEDPESRSPAEGGRRIIPIAPGRKWGWKVVNHDYYRSLSGDERYRESVRERVRRFREKRNVTSVTSNVSETLLHGSGSVLGSGSVPEGVQGWQSANGKPHDTIALTDRFWAAYPKKVCQDDMRHAWVEVNASEHADAIFDALAWQVKSENWNRENGRFIPNPATWLRDRRWYDEPTKVDCPVSGLSLEDRIKTIEAGIANNPANPNSIRYNRNCTANDKELLKKMRGVLRELTDKKLQEAVHG